MTIDEAIENRTAYLKNSKVPKSAADYNATLLGIEALKAWREHRRIMGHPKLWILPGETQD